MTITRRFLPDDFINSTSLIPRPSPMPKIGPISGEMSIAPMTTGMELTFRPMDAMMMAIAKIQALGPRKYMLLRIFFSADSVTMCPARLIDERNNTPMFFKIPRRYSAKFHKYRHFVGIMQSYR